ALPRDRDEGGDHRLAPREPPGAALGEEAPEPRQVDLGREVDLHRPGRRSGARQRSAELAGELLLRRPPGGVADGDLGALAGEEEAVVTTGGEGERGEQQPGAGSPLEGGRALGPPSNGERFLRADARGRRG